MLLLNNLNRKNVETSKELAKLYYFKKMNDKSIKLWKTITELVPEDETLLKKVSTSTITKQF